VEEGQGRAERGDRTAAPLRSGTLTTPDPSLDDGPVSLGAPRVRLVLAFPAPAVERIVDHHPVSQHLAVVGEQTRKTKRDREQASGLWRESEFVRVRTAHDRCEFEQGRVT